MENSHFFVQSAYHLYFFFISICIIKLLHTRLLLFLRPSSTCFCFAGPISLMLHIALYITRTYKNVSALCVELLSLTLKEELRSFSFSHLFHRGCCSTGCHCLKSKTPSLVGREETGRAEGFSRQTLCSLHHVAAVGWCGQAGGYQTLSGSRSELHSGYTGRLCPACLGVCLSYLLKLSTLSAAASLQVTAH